MKQITEESGIQKEWYEEAKKQTPKTFPGFFKKLTEDYNHDYGTVCHAIAAAALGAANAVNHSPQGGITGFQAGAVMWEMIRGWGVFGHGPKRMTCYRDMLYPQYKDKFTTIDKATWADLQVEAKNNLEKESGHPNVIAHWRTIAAGVVPFGYTIREED